METDVGDTDATADTLRSFFRWLIHLRSGVGAGLMTRIATADQEAFSEFYDLSAGRVFAIVQSVIRDVALSEELTSEIFLEFWKTAPSRVDTFEPLRSVVLFARYRAEERRLVLDGGPVTA